jgi:hypothetical protein
MCDAVDVPDAAVATLSNHFVHVIDSILDGSWRHHPSKSDLLTKPVPAPVVGADVPQDAKNLVKRLVSIFVMSHLY